MVLCMQLHTTAGCFHPKGLSTWMLSTFAGFIGHSVSGYHSDSQPRRVCCPPPAPPPPTHQACDEPEPPIINGSLNLPAAAAAAAEVVNQSSHD
jgi:hypothetical protein